MSTLEHYLNSEAARQRRLALSAVAYARLGAYLAQNNPSKGELADMAPALVWFAQVGPLLVKELPALPAEAPHRLLRLPELVAGGADRRIVLPPTITRSDVETLTSVRTRVLEILDAQGNPQVDEGFDAPRAGGGTPRYSAFTPAMQNAGASFARSQVRGQCDSEVSNAKINGTGGANTDYDYFDSLLIGLFASAASVALIAIAPVVAAVGAILVPRMIGAIVKEVDTYLHNDVPGWN